MKRKINKFAVTRGLIIVGIIIVVITGFLLYKHFTSYEYKLGKVGYNKSEINTIVKLKNNDIEKLIKKKYNKNIVPLLKQKYFMWKNLDKYLNYTKKNKNNYKNIVSIINTGANKSWYKDAATADMSKGYAVLVNKFHLLKSGYKPSDIVNVSNWYAYSDMTIRKSVYNAFINMYTDAKNKNLNLIINSGYRTEEFQTNLYNDYKDWYGSKYADNYAARPNSSEHQTGLALDIVSPGAKSDNFKDSDEYKWLVKNSYKYGFILRYPKNKEFITGYKYESWHYRYLGKSLAKKVYDSGLTYDEYYAYYIEK